MANAGKNTNESQFFISMVKCLWLNGKHVVFGKVTKGMDVLKVLEGEGTHPQGKTLSNCVIKNCGEILTS